MFAGAAAVVSWALMLWIWMFFLNPSRMFDMADSSVSLASRFAAYIACAVGAVAFVRILAGSHHR